MCGTRRDPHATPWRHHPCSVWRCHLHDTGSGAKELVAAVIVRLDEESVRVVVFQWNDSLAPIGKVSLAVVNGSHGPVALFYGPT